MLGGPPDRPGSRRLTPAEPPQRRQPSRRRAPRVGAHRGATRRFPRAVAASPCCCGAGRDLLGLVGYCGPRTAVSRTPPGRGSRPPPAASGRAARRPRTGGPVGGRAVHQSLRAARQRPVTGARPSALPGDRVGRSNHGGRDRARVHRGIGSRARGVAVREPRPRTGRRSGAAARASVTEILSTCLYAGSVGSVCANSSIRQLSSLRAVFLSAGEGLSRIESLSRRPLRLLGRPFPAAPPDPPAALPPSRSARQQRACAGRPLAAARRFAAVPVTSRPRDGRRKTSESRERPLRCRRWIRTGCGRGSACENPGAW